jgi:hypothetical protein
MVEYPHFGGIQTSTVIPETLLLGLQLPIADISQTTKYSQNKLSHRTHINKNTSDCWDRELQLLIFQRTKSSLTVY